MDNLLTPRSKAVTDQKLLVCQHRLSYDPEFIRCQNSNLQSCAQSKKDKGMVKSEGWEAQESGWENASPLQVQMQRHQALADSHCPWVHVSNTVQISKVESLDMKVTLRVLA